MKQLVFYVHGRGGSAAEAERYRSLFPDSEVLGLEYQANTPWETGPEIRAGLLEAHGEGRDVILIANSIGAFFCMCAGIEALVQKAYFISPIVDMERLIADMMAWSGVTEAELESRGVIPTAGGEDLSWEYLCWVRAHPIHWEVPTELLYGGRDVLTARETAAAFAQRHNAGLTVMENGEHWFHTDEHLAFLDRWLLDKEQGTR